MARARVCFRAKLGSKMSGVKTGTGGLLAGGVRVWGEGGDAAREV